MSLLHNSSNSSEIHLNAIWTSFLALSEAVFVMMWCDTTLQCHNICSKSLQHHQCNSGQVTQAKSPRTKKKQKNIAFKVTRKMWQYTKAYKTFANIKPLMLQHSNSMQKLSYYGYFVYFVRRNHQGHVLAWKLKNCRVPQPSLFCCSKKACNVYNFVCNAVQSVPNLC